MVASIINDVQSCVIVARCLEFLERLFSSFGVHPVMITICEATND